MTMDIVRLVSLPLVYWKSFGEDRITAHMERVNNSKNTITIYISDLVIAHTNMQSDKTKDKSVNPWYKVQVPF